MQKEADNYAFIDGTNLYLAAASLGFKIDFARFRVYLREKLGVSLAHYFVGYRPEYKGLYERLGRDGYVLTFKPVSVLRDGTVKGNCDPELVLQAMIDIESYNKAVIVSSDGDFACLVKYLNSRGKLRQVLACSRSNCSHHLQLAAGPKLAYLDQVQHLIRERETVEGEPRREGTQRHSPSS